LFNNWLNREVIFNIENIKTILKVLVSNIAIVVIPALTCLGYLFAYSFELGTANFYNIPSYYISVDLFRALFVAMLMYIFVVLVSTYYAELIFNFFLPLLKTISYLLNRKLYMKVKFIRKIKHASRMKYTAIVTLTCSIIIFFLFQAEQVGKGIANDNKNYFIFHNSGKDYALVGIYGDNIFGLELDEKKVC
jgi:hypothetical protein